MGNLTTLPYEGVRKNKQRGKTFKYVYISYLPIFIGQDMTQGQFLSGV